jgi:hypothetical protein
MHRQFHGPVLGGYINHDQKKRKKLQLSKTLLYPFVHTPMCKHEIMHHLFGCIFYVSQSLWFIVDKLTRNASQPSSVKAFLLQ